MPDQALRLLAHMNSAELDEAARRRDIKVDGKLVLEIRPVKNPDGSENKGLVWQYVKQFGLCRVAERFKI
ncbi:hypothetical protein M378DRAFT_169362, partial [Amanita muscaria Koide BX008]